MAMLNNQSVIIYTIVIWYVMNYMVSNCSLICRLTGLFKMCLANYHSEFLWDWWNDWWAETRQTLGDFGVCVVIKPRKLAQYLGFHRISAMEIGIDGWTTEQSKKVGFNQRKIESVKCQAWRFTLSKGRIKPSKIQSQRKSWCNLVTGWDGLDFLFGSSLESHWFDHWIGQCLSSEWHFWCQSMAGFFGENLKELHGSNSWWRVA